MSVNIVFLELASHNTAHVVPADNAMVNIQRIDGKEILQITENGDTYFPQVWKCTEASLKAGAYPRDDVFLDHELGELVSA